MDITPWSWDISNGNASASQTETAYSAVQGKQTYSARQSKGLLSDFSHLVWNDMIDKVKKILDILGESWDDKYASYVDTKMSSLDKVLTAKRFNSLRYNIEIHYPTGIDEVSTGDIVYGSYFTTLADCINSWIEKKESEL